jgi:hypothetical protein
MTTVFGILAICLGIPGGAALLIWALTRDG